VANLEIVEGDMPEVLDSLPTPHRVFVGGGGANLGDILGRAARALASEGVIVVSAVRLESQETARRELSALGFSVETAQVQVSHGESLAGGEYLKAYNPVWLVTGTKPGEEA
jgi:precorrin-6Y C5,15-methyltransferase (decarboxylating)